jgi:UrcA family protein
MNKRYASAIFAIWLSLHATLSHSEPSAFPVARVVHSDLDLNRHADWIKLRHRLRTAIDEVCGFALTGDLRGQNNVKRCLKETSHNATSQMETAVFEAMRTRRAPQSELER